MPTKYSITQRLWTDLGRSVGLISDTGYLPFGISHKNTLWKVVWTISHQNIFDDVTFSSNFTITKMIHWYMCIVITCSSFNSIFIYLCLLKWTRLENAYGSGKIQLQFTSHFHQWSVNVYVHDHNKIKERLYSFIHYQINDYENFTSHYIQSAHWLIAA